MKHYPQFEVYHLRTTAGPSESDMHSQLMQFFRGKRSRVSLPVGFLVIDTNGISVPGDVKSADLGSLNVIAQATQELRQLI